MKWSMMALIISIIMYLILMISMKYNTNKSKMSSFECGFNPFQKANNPFSIQFFKILLIFLLFDMELILILPIPLNSMYTFSLMNSLIALMALLLFGLMYEWKEGALEWLK